MPDQTQFLTVVDRDEAERRFQGALRLAALPAEPVALPSALGRVLADDVAAPGDVPSFDRSNYDGYAVRAADTHGADEEHPRLLALRPDPIATGRAPEGELDPGVAWPLATGAMLPRGADAVVMVEHADAAGDHLLVRRSVTAGFGVSFAGSDIAHGEIVVRRGERLTSRETGVLAAVGVERVAVVGRPRVGILSTGDEIIPPGAPMRPGLVYDSNARILADAVRELGGEPVEGGVVADDLPRLRTRLAELLAACDLVLLSGGTSKGAGDVSYRAVAELTDPGIVAHGVALKPGKPICLAASGGKGVVVLPGFPTSAIFTFHEFVAPVLRRLAGFAPDVRETVAARLAVKVNSEIGRTEYLLVSLIPPAGERHAEDAASLVAFPMGKGSGSVTAFSRADGFVTIDRHEELLDAGTTVAVQLLGGSLAPADLVVIGSHCVGLDWLLGQVQETGLRTKFLAVGSTAGLAAAQRGECDVAGIHLLDPVTGRYNEPFVTPELELIRGYRRLQGVLFRRGDARFEGRAATAAVAAVRDDPACRMVNRNAGSGTRILLDGLLGEARPPGYAVQPRSHTAVAAAIAQGRADWGVAVRTVADAAGLGFLPLAVEHYDFVAPKSRLARPAVAALRRLLHDRAVQDRLRSLGGA